MLERVQEQESLAKSRVCGTVNANPMPIQCMLNDMQSVLNWCEVHPCMQHATPVHAQTCK